MTINGPDALRSIEEALRDIRREEAEAVRRLARSVELGAKLKAQEGEVLRQLAALRLEPAARTALTTEIAKVETESASLLERYEQRLSEAETEMAELDSQIANATVERAELQAETARRENELGTLAAKARPKLGTDPGYAQKLGEARELSAIAEQAVRKTAEAEADRELKGRPYRDDPLFMYLWSRSYGTSGYRANALAAWLDGKVAALIGYGNARANFALLNDIPLRFRDHADLQRDRARAAAAEIAALESVAVDSAGGRAAREAIEQLSQRVAALDREIVALQDRRDEAAKAERELAEGADPSFSTALQTVSQVLDGIPVRTLIADARATPKGQDVTLVQQLDDLRQRGKDEADEAREQRSRLRTLAARRRDLEDIQYEIKAQHFDSPRCRLSDDELTGVLLNELLRGGVSAGAYWERWRTAQSWIEPGMRAPARASGTLSRPRGSATPARPEGLITAA
jgi:hypothetical protein